MPLEKATTIEGVSEPMVICDGVLLVGIQIFVVGESVIINSDI